MSDTPRMEMSFVCQTYPEWRCTLCVRHTQNGDVLCVSDIPRMEMCIVCQKYPEWRHVLCVRHTQNGDMLCIRHTLSGETCFACQTYPEWRDVLCRSDIPTAETCFVSDIPIAERHCLTASCPRLEARVKTCTSPSRQVPTIFLLRSLPSAASWFST